MIDPASAGFFLVYRKESEKRSQLNKQEQAQGHDRHSCN